MEFKKDVWLYSKDGEYFDSHEYESKEAAIKAARNEGFESCFYVGKKEDASIPTIHTNHVLEDIQEDIYDECGESGENWVQGMKDEDIKKLDNKLNNIFFKWINESGYNPNWYKIVDVEKINTCIKQ